MSGVIPGLLSLAALAAVLYLLIWCYRPASVLKSLVKTLSVAALAVAAGLSGAPVWLVIALTLCAAGDYLLSRDTDSTFLAGVAAFALGHLAYVALFVTTPGTELSRLLTPGILVIVLGLLIYGAVMMRALWRTAGELRVAVMVYVPIIVAMGITALTVPEVDALAVVAPAAFLFMASDSALAAELFLLRPIHPLRRLTPFVIWSLYWLAQLGFYHSYVG